MYFLLSMAGFNFFTAELPNREARLNFLGMQPYELVDTCNFSMTDHVIETLHASDELT